MTIAQTWQVSIKVPRLIYLQLTLLHFILHVPVIALIFVGIMLQKVVLKYRSSLVLYRNYIIF